MQSLARIKAAAKQLCKVRNIDWPTVLFAATVCLWTPKRTVTATNQAFEQVLTCTVGSRGVWQTAGN
jgi:hypothetical protein